MRQEIYTSPVYCLVEDQPSSITVFALDFREALFKIERALKKTGQFIITNEIKLRDFTSNDYEI